MGSNYGDEKLFEKDFQGYLNINGLKEANHMNYFNSDMNLVDLDLIVLAETKLQSKDKVDEHMSSWIIVGRYDAPDNKAHMGMLLLKSKKSSLEGQLSVAYMIKKRNGSPQIEGLIVGLPDGMTFGFVYSRSTPTQAEVLSLRKNFRECQFILGDLNLSHRDSSDQQKLLELCQPDKVNILNEITRSVSNNQLDYIISQKNLSKRSYATSFNNFISDHKSITVRVALEENNFLIDVAMKINFDRESHLKSKKISTSNSDKSLSYSSSSSSSTDSVESVGLDDVLPTRLQQDASEFHSNQRFSRKFKM